MSNVIVVGSGPSGIHLAATLVERGRSVTMLDVGNKRPEVPLPSTDFDGLKEALDDPASYFLGDDGRGIIFPAREAKYFVIPPTKDYVFRRPRSFGAAARNIEPAIAFASGGLAEAWTGGCYTLNDGELTDFPLDLAALEPHYATIAKRIGITAANDDLTRFCDWRDHYLEPIPPDPNSALLLARYARHRKSLNRDLGFHLGRSRVAVLSEPRGERQACDRLGRCLWGCPRNSIYAPSSTLAELRRHAAFRYVPGSFVTHFDYKDGAITSVYAERPDGRTEKYSATAYALAAGTLCSSKIFLDSIYRRTGNSHKLPGLLDNAQVLVPFLNLGRLGRPVDTHAYQFHQIALGISGARADEYVHGQLTTLKSASVHPVAQSLPLDLRSALDIFRVAHAALGAANIWLHDRRTPENFVTVRPSGPENRTELVIECVPNQPERFEAPIKTVKRALRRLGCFVPPGMTKILPKGSSIHYAGTLPMQSEPGTFSCDAECRSYDFRNLYFGDGASFPFLPAKNITYTLMANASRVADAIHKNLTISAGSAPGPE